MTVPLETIPLGGWFVFRVGRAQDAYVGQRRSGRRQFDDDGDVEWQAGIVWQMSDQAWLDEDHPVEPIPAPPLGVWKKPVYS